MTRHSSLAQPKMSVKFEQETVKNAAPTGDRKAGFLQEMTQQTAQQTSTKNGAEGKTKPGYLAVRTPPASAAARWKH